MRATSGPVLSSVSLTVTPLAYWNALAMALS